MGLVIFVAGVVVLAIVHDVCCAVVDCRRAKLGKCCRCCEPQDESVDVNVEDES